MVTPTLFMGDARHMGAIPVNGYREAIAVILEGGRAQLPIDSWDEARKVLEEFTADQVHVEQQIHWARSGSFF